MTQRYMARKVRAPVPRPALIALAIGAVLIVGLLGAMAILGGGPKASNAPSTASSPLASLQSSLVAQVSVSPSPSVPGSSSAQPSAASSASPTPTSGQPTPTAGSLPPASPPPNAAPQSAADFDVHNQVIEIGFPLRADTPYHYRDNWYERRSGPPDPYNHAKANANGDLVRLHDGIDIYAPENEPVLAPFDGTVIDPATKWIPWQPDRYGLTVVVESDEPATTGYTAVLVHLDHVWVDIGQHVTRGQVIGVLGRTGNAESVPPQLHFELRAPFLINWSALGEDRDVDAFNPYPSLIAADPNPAGQPQPSGSPPTGP